MTYTHIFRKDTKQLVSLAEASEAVLSVGVRTHGFLLVDAERIQMDQHGHPCYRTGGWSYGHIQHGYICAGAGGLNSLPVLPLNRG